MTGMYGMRSLEDNTIIALSKGNINGRNSIVVFGKKH